MKYPRLVYVIFPYDEEGKVAGAYIGSSANMQWRMVNHRCQKAGKGEKQDRLHELMRKNGCAYKILDVINCVHENHIEYDWINLFAKYTNFEIFNTQTDCLGADCERIPFYKISHAVKGPTYKFGRMSV